MIINRVDDVGKNITICTARDFVHILAQKIFDNDILKKTDPENYFPNVSFAARVNEYNKIEISQDVKLDDIEACSWLGIQPVKGFDSMNLDLVCNYYGGGCASLTSLFDGMSQDEIEEELAIMIQGSTEMGGVGVDKDEMIYVQWDDVIENHYEVHEIEDTCTGEPRYCNSFTLYEEALSLYQSIDEEKKPARLLLVDKEGMPIYEIKSNY